MKRVEDALRRQVGVTDMTTNIQTNWVTIRPDPRQLVPLVDIPKAVKRSGFHPAGMTIRASGAWEKTDTGRAFRITGWDTPLTVLGDAAPPAGPEYTFEVQYKGDALSLRLASP